MNDLDALPPLVSKRQAMKALHLSLPRVQDLIDNGVLRTWTPTDGKPRILSSSLKDFIRNGHA